MNRKRSFNIQEKITKINSGIESLESELASFKNQIEALNKRLSYSWKMARSVLFVHKALRKTDRGVSDYNEITGKGNECSMRARWGDVEKVNRKSRKINKRKF